MCKLPGEKCVSRKECLANQRKQSNSSHGVTLHPGSCSLLLREGHTELVEPKVGILTSAQPPGCCVALAHELVFKQFSS